jgi:hypothetical protein
MPLLINQAPGSGGGVDSVTAGDSTITIAGTASDPTVAINLATANTWTGVQTFGEPVVTTNLRLANGAFIQGRNSADTAWLDLIEMRSTNRVRIPSSNGAAAWEVGVAWWFIGAGGTTANQFSIGRLDTTGNGGYNVETGATHQLRVNNVTILNAQTAQTIAPRFLTNTIASSSSSASFRGLAGNSSSLYYPGGTMSQNLTQVFTATNAEEVLLTRSVLAQEINRVEGQGIIMKAFGRLNNPSVPTFIRVRFDGIEVFNSGDLDGAGTPTWQIESIVNRTTANNIIVCTTLLIDGVQAIVQTDDFSVIMTGAVDFNLTAESDPSEVRKDWGKYYYDPMA